jgi:hypothetical protein
VKTCQAAVACFAMLLAPLRLAAQTSNAVITGRVTDPSKALIVGAQVALINTGTNARIEVVTNNTGTYVIEAIPPGSYRAEVEKTGFKTIVETGVVLHVQDTVELNFEMALGTPSESVTVNANAEHLRTDDPAVGVLVNRDFVENMPLNGRSFQDLLALAPGTVADVNNGGLYSINGQRGDANYFTVDGVAANTNSSTGGNPGDTRGLAGVLPAQTTSGTTQSLISVDALQEFKVQTAGYSAENGRQPGGQIELTSRSGSNNTHGTLYDYFRNEALDANAWTANFGGIPRQPHRQNDFGGTIGGPFRIPKLYNGKDSTFYFVSYEGLRLTIPNTVDAATVPTEAFRQFASPTLQPFLNALPLPNGPLNGDMCAASLNPSNTFSCTGQFSGAFSNVSSINSTSVRIDQIIGQRLELFVRFADTPSQTFQFLTGSKSGGDQNQHALTVGSTWRVSQNLVDQLRFNWTENYGHNISAPAATDGSVPYPSDLLVPKQYAPAGSVTAGTVEIVLSGPGFFDFISPAGYQDSLTRVRQYNLVNSMTWTRGVHSLTFGVDFRRLQSLYNAPQYASFFAVESAASVQQGLADLVQIQAGQPGSPIFNNLSLYAQDTWKLTHRLTLDLGIRWEFNPAPGAVNGKFPLALTTGNLANAQLAPVGTPQYHTKYDAFAPRIGFAYQLNSSQNHPLVARGGFGIFYDTGQNFGAAGYIGYPFGAVTTVTNVPFPVSSSANQLAPPTLNFPLVPPYGQLFPLFLNDPNLVLPYTDNWNLSLNVGLSARNTLTASYVGNVGKKLLFTQLYPDLSATNPLFATLQLTKNAASSNYNALQVQDQGYVARGMQLIASYTWAHALDNNSSDLNLAEFPPVRGNSDNDIRQVFNLALNYKIPSASSSRFLRALTYGWALDQRFTAQTGTPVNVIQGAYLTNPGQTTVPIYPDIVQGVPVVLHNVPGDPFGWALNPAAFSPVPLNADGSPVRQGTEPRNFIHGPGFWNLTTAVQRDFPITERFGLSFRVDAFNVLNHPNPSSPDACLCDGSSFGKIGFAGTSFGVPNQLYATGSARSLQLSLKLHF